MTARSSSAKASDLRSGSDEASRAYHHGDLREALIAAAFAEVEAKGPDVVSLSALARRLGVSQAAPYRHFADREELLTAVATKGFQAAATWIGEAADRAASGSRLLRLAHAYLAFALDHVGLYQLMYASRLLQRSAADSEIYRAADAGFDMTLAAIDPTLDEFARRRLALKFWTSLHGVVMLTERGLLPPKIRQISVADLIDDLVQDTERGVEAARGS